MASQPKSAKTHTGSGDEDHRHSDIGFLHTAEVHVATFDALARPQGLSVVHRVEETWLREAIDSGLTDSLREQVERALVSLQRKCGVVICTCSTLGDIATQLQRPHVFRVDQPMMDMAAAESGPVYLAYCLDSTRHPSTALLQSAFVRAGRTDNFELIDCGAAWPLFEQGRIEKFGQTIARRITDVVLRGSHAPVVVLAQASMAAAQPWLPSDTELRSLASPGSAMDHATRLLL